MKSGDRVMIRGLGEAILIRLEPDRHRALVRRELSTGQMSQFLEHVPIADLRLIETSGHL